MFVCRQNDFDFIKALLHWIGISIEITGVGLIAIEGWLKLKFNTKGHSEYVWMIVIGISCPFKSLPLNLSAILIHGSIVWLPLTNMEAALTGAIPLSKSVTANLVDTSVDHGLHVTSCNPQNGVSRLNLVFAPLGKHKNVEFYIKSHHWISHHWITKCSQSTVGRPTALHCTTACSVHLHVYMASMWRRWERWVWQQSILLNI